MQLVGRKGEADDKHRLCLYPEYLTRSVARPDLAPALAALATGNLGEWKPASRRLLLVCTHGQKDCRCAHWSLPLTRRSPRRRQKRWRCLKARISGLSTCGFGARAACHDQIWTCHARRGGGVAWSRGQERASTTSVAQAWSAFAVQTRRVKRPATCADLDARKIRSGTSWC